MPLIQRLETRFGLTRGDVTIALFLAAIALCGALYTEFIEDERTFRQRTDLARLIARSDSVTHERQQRESASLSFGADSTAEEWEPLSEEEVLEEGTSGSSEGRSAQLTLEDVAPVDINRAPSKVLELLPGVGETIGERIINARPFRRIEDILRVKGIGPKKFEKLRPWITVGSVKEKEEESAAVKEHEEEQKPALPDSSAKRREEQESGDMEKEIEE